MQTNRHPCCSNTAPIPTTDAFVTSTVDLFDTNWTSVGLSEMSLINLYKVLSNSLAHRHSSDDCAENSVCSLVGKLKINRWYYRRLPIKESRYVGFLGDSFHDSGFQCWASVQ